MFDDLEKNEGEIDIINQPLWNLLKSLLGHYPYHLFQGPPLTFGSPYESFVFCWDKLEQAAKEIAKDDNDKQARSDLKLLLDTISSSSGCPKLDKYFKIRDSNKQQKSVTFETLWTIFPPGSLVYGQPFQGQDQVFLVQDNLQTWPYRQRRPSDEQAYWDLICWTYDWDGKRFRRLRLNLEFEYFDGHKPISSLPYYPFELNDQYDIIKDKLIEQGKTYRRFCTARQGSRMFEYNGEATFVKKGFSGVQGDNEVGLSVTTRSAAQDII